MSMQTRNRPFWTDLSEFKDELDFKIAVLALCKIKGTNQKSIRIIDLEEEIQLYRETYNYYYRINLRYIEGQKHENHLIETK